MRPNTAQPKPTTMSREYAQLQRSLEEDRNEVMNFDTKSIQELKSLRAPPAKVIETLNAVMLVLGEKENFESAKKQMADPRAFLNRLLSFSKEALDHRFIEKLESRYTLTPEEVGRVSRAAGLLSKWLHGLIKYHKLESLKQGRKVKIETPCSHTPITEDKMKVYQDKTLNKKAKEM